MFYKIILIFLIYIYVSNTNLLLNLLKNLAPVFLYDSTYVYFVPISCNIDGNR